MTAPEQVLVNVEAHADLLATIVDALLVEGHEAISANLRGQAHSAVVAYRNLSGFYEEPAVTDHPEQVLVNVADLEALREWFEGKVITGPIMQRIIAAKHHRSSEGDAPGGAAVTELVDRDEYGEPVSDRYRRLGAGADEEGMYVRFEPGFGLNVHIGKRQAGQDRELLALGIGGWDALCSLVDEWRRREGLL